MKTFLLPIFLWVGTMSSLCAQGSCDVMDGLPAEGCNVSYISHRQPLVAQPLIKLPAGSIRPGGWLLTQLQLQRDGLNGHLGEISAWLQKDDNAWLKQGGKWGWEEVPYWLRGYSSLAYALHDKALLEEAKQWIEAILKSQRADGNFGPVVKNNDAQDFWPNMLALWIVQSYYEYTGDKRVIDFMTRYFQFELTVPDKQFLSSYWENSRGGDNLWSVVWLYDRTGNAELLKLADKIHRCTADWTDASSLPNWHNVNVAQSFREPATYYLFHGQKEMLRASYNVQSLVRRAFGQMPGGMFAADENARMGYFDPRQGTETCGFAEQMASDEIMLLITGDPAWAENCEDVAFNSYPAALMPDYRSLRYLTCPNMVVSDSRNHSPGLNNAGPFLAMNPFSSRCCQHNHGFAWPYYLENLVYATPDNGAAIVMYNTCEAQMKVGEKKDVTIHETTDYPFDTKVHFRIETRKAVAFPLYLRIPRWTEMPTVTVNGQNVEVQPEAGKYLRIHREWKNGDVVDVNLPMKVSFRHWQVNKNSVSVDYGPLTLSLKIKEKLVQLRSDQTAIGDSKWQKGADTSKWPTFEIYADSPWNYALETSSPIELVEHKALQPNVNPFTVQNSPLTFKAKGRLVPEWKIDKYGLCGVLPYEDAEKSDSEDDIELIPMGAARLRISAFPTCK